MKRRILDFLYNLDRAGANTLDAAAAMDNGKGIG